MILCPPTATHTFLRAPINLVAIGSGLIAGAGLAIDDGHAP